MEGNSLSRQGNTANGPEGKLAVFVSYSRKDALDFADQLVQALEAYGYEPILDRHGISGAENWRQRLGALIRGADTVVFVLSPGSARSDVCAWEIEEAERLSKRIIPIVAVPLGSEPTPERLAKLNYIYFYPELSYPGSGFGGGLARLVKALESDLTWLREHTRLAERAQEWDERGRQPHRLLSGADIAEAKSWVARQPKTAPDPTPLQLDYIKASETEEILRADAAQKQIEERERLLQTAEVERVAREKALADTELAQQERAAALAQAAEAQKARIRFAFAAVVVLLATTAFALSMWRTAKLETARANEQTMLADAAAVTAKKEADRAEAEQKKAEEEKARAESARNLALQNQSRFLLTRASEVEKLNPELALLLALEAVPHDVGDRPVVKGAAKALISAMTGVESNPNTLLAGHSDRVTDAVFDVSGKRVATASNDGTARVWDPPDKITALSGHAGHVNSVAFSADGKRLLTASDDKTARVWDINGSKEIVVLRGHQNRVNTAVFSADGNLVLTSSDDGSARVWNAGNGTEVAVLKHPVALVWSAVFAADGQRAATTADDATARLWDVRSGTLLHELKGHELLVTYCSFSPDGKRLVTASTDHTARVWDVDTGNEVAVIEGHGNQVSRAVFSPDGTMIATGSHDDTARVWDSAAGAEVAVLTGHTDVINSVQFSSDSQRVVTSSRDSTVRVWQSRTGEVVSVLAGHVAEVWTAVFSSDGNFVVSASDDNTARIWPLRPAGAGKSSSTERRGKLELESLTEIVREAEVLALRCLTPQERRSLFLDVVVPRWCYASDGKWPYKR